MTIFVIRSSPSAMTNVFLNAMSCEASNNTSQKVGSSEMAKAVMVSWQNQMIMKVWSKLMEWIEKCSASLKCVCNTQKCKPKNKQHNCGKKLVIFKNLIDNSLTTRGNVEIKNSHELTSHRQFFAMVLLIAIGRLDHFVVDQMQFNKFFPNIELQIISMMKD